MSSQPTTSVHLQALSEGMHALAQPLAIVQGTLEIATMGATTLDEYQKAVEESLAQIERAAELLNYVKELVKVSRAHESARAVPAIAVFGEVFEDLRCVFNESKVRLEMHCEDSMGGVAAQETQMRQALFYMLQAARSYAGEGATVKLDASMDGDCIRVWIRTESARGKVVSLETVSTSSVARSIALADTIVTRNGGKFSFETDPFSTRLWFPIAHPAGQIEQRTGTE
jgi:K+-sensing histidine kinase KdpD